MGFFWTIVTLVVALGLTWRYLGSYMAAVFDGRVHFLAWAERPVYSLLGTSPDNEQSWQRYAGSMIIFSGISFAVHLHHLADPGLAAAQPSAPWGR